jgi:hypothetical protein
MMLLPHKLFTSSGVSDPDGLTSLDGGASVKGVMSMGVGMVVHGASGP